MGRVFFYVQHLLGVGHVKRAACLTRAMSAHGLDVSVALGGFPVSLADFGEAELVQLPPARSADTSFSALVDENNRPIDDDWREIRRKKLLGLYDEIRPDIVLIEHFPFGRRSFRFELLPLLERAKTRSAIASSVRDVLVAKDKPQRNREIAQIVKDYFNRIFVHGQKDIIPFEATFPYASDFKERISYTGYVSEDPPKGMKNSEIIVSTGGGAVGEALLQAALGARLTGTLADYRWRLLAGGNLGEAEFQALRSQAPEGVIVERARPDFRELLAGAALSVSQGGYNSVMDVISAGCPNLIVPFAEGAESEQTFRAQEFDRRGYIKLFNEGELTHESLGVAMINALQAGQPENAGLDLDGARTAAQLIGELI